MKSISLVLLALVLCAQVFGQKKVLNHNLILEQGQITLTEAQKEELQSLTKGLPIQQRVIVYPLINNIAHSGLSYDRKAKIQAKAIAEYCKTIGFEVLGTPANFPSMYRGLSASANLKYLGNKEAPASKPNTLAGHYPEKPSQFFVIDPKRDTILEGNEGTRLFFPAGSLNSEEMVQVELKEFYSMSDYLKSGLTTSSNGRMLETGGTIFLDAKEDSPSQKPVKIDPKKPIEAEFTNGKDDSKMEIFVPDPRTTGSINWIRPNRTRSSWQMTKTIKHADGSITELVFNSKAEWEAYLAEEKRKEEARIAEAKRREEEARAQRLAWEKANPLANKLQIAQFGFINCDRFPSQQSQPMLVQTNSPKQTEFFLIFQDVRGVMQGQSNGQQVKFGAVPLNTPAVFMAVKYVDDKPQIYEREIKHSGNSMSLNLELKPVSESYLNGRLADL